MDILGFNCERVFYMGQFYGVLWGNQDRNFLKNALVLFHWVEAFLVPQNYLNISLDIGSATPAMPPLLAKSDRIREVSFSPAYQENS